MNMYCCALCIEGFPVGRARRADGSAVRRYQLSRFSKSGVWLKRLTVSACN